MDPLDPGVTAALNGWRTQFQAGIGLPETLELCAPLTRGLARRCFEEAARRAQSESFDRILDALALCLPPSETAALAAGFKHGRLEAVLEAVVQRRELWALTRTRIRAKMILPVAVLLIGSFVAPLPMLVSTGNIFLYGICAFTPLLVLLVGWMLAASFFNARAMQRPGQPDTAPGGGFAAPQPPGALDHLLLTVPIVSAVEKSRNLAEFSGMVGTLFGAGAPLGNALQLCAETIPNGFYRADLARCAAETRSGRKLADSFQALPPERWPREYVAALAVGEQAGALEESFKRQAAHFRERYTAAVEALGEWLPRIIYGIIAIFIIINIFLLASGLYGSYAQVLSPEPR